MNYQTKVLLLVLSLTVSGFVFGCDKKDIIFKPFVQSEIANKIILNGSSVNMYKFISPNCSIDCYAEFLNKKGIESILKGSVFSVLYKNEIISLSLHSSHKNSFSGNIICESAKKFKKLKIISLPILDKPKTDFQATDRIETSRTITYTDLSKSRFIEVIKTLKKNSKKSSINEDISSFDLKDGSKVYLTYAKKRGNVGTLVIVFRRGIIR